MLKDENESVNAKINDRGTLKALRPMIDRQKK